MTLLIGSRWSSDVFKGGLRKFSTTATVLKKKPKAELVLVACKSIASDHQISVRKSRLGDKVEFLAFDPEIQREVIYKEMHKIKSIREDFDNWYTQPSELRMPDSFKESS